VVDTAGKLVAGTYTTWSATVTSGTSLAIVATPLTGSDQVYSAGSTTQVYMPVSSVEHNTMVDGLLVAHDQDGTLKAGAVDNAAVLANDVVETAKIKDKAATLAKVNGGTTAGVLTTDTSGNVTPVSQWWEEIGRTTLGSAGDTISVTVPVRKYLTIIVNLVPVGVIAPWVRFNADAANNYAFRYSVSYAASVDVVSTDGISIDPSSTGTKTMATVNVENILFTEKLVSGQAVNPGSAGAANIGAAIDIFGKWANNTNYITSVSIVNKGAGDFGIGSEVVVLGHD